MNTFQNSQERRTIRVKEFLDDFHAGMMDEDLLTKYRLTPAGLEKFYGMLQERGILAPDEISARYGHQDNGVEEGGPALETSCYICPSCLASHETMFDICPHCGVSFQDLMSADDHSTPKRWPEESEESEESEELFGPPESLWSEPVFDEKSDLPPIEIEEHPLVEEDFHALFGEQRPDDDLTASAELTFGDIAREEFGGAVASNIMPPDPKRAPAVPFDDDLPHDTNTRVPFEDDSEVSAVNCPEIPRPHCGSCKQDLRPALRDVYDHNRSRLALLLSGVFLVLVFFGAGALSFFDGYSLGRLFVVYITGMFLLFGAVFGAVGSFMYLAREKVYYCESCERIYPRG